MLPIYKRVSGEIKSMRLGEGELVAILADGEPFVLTITGYLESKTKEEIKGARRFEGQYADANNYYIEFYGKTHILERVIFGLFPVSMRYEPSLALHRNNAMGFTMVT